MTPRQPIVAPFHGSVVGTPIPCEQVHPGQPCPRDRDNCPVHTGTPEPCPVCESMIAAGL